MSNFHIHGEAWSGIVLAGVEGEHSEVPTTTTQAQAPDLPGACGVDQPPSRVSHTLGSTTS